MEDNTRPEAELAAAPSGRGANGLKAAAQARSLRGAPGGEAGASSPRDPEGWAEASGGLPAQAGVRAQAEGQTIRAQADPDFIVGPSLGQRGARGACCVCRPGSGSAGPRLGCGSEEEQRLTGFALFLHPAGWV